MSISTPEVKMGRIEAPVVDTRKTITLSINVKKFMSNILWVLKAKSDDDNRDVLKYLNIDNNGFYCTDGRRLHLCSDLSCLPTGLENGLYQVNICKDVIVFIPKGGEFPKYMDVIPSYDIEGIKIDLAFSKYDKDNESARYSTSLIKIAGLMNYQSGINIDYLKDLRGYVWTVQGKSEKTPRPIKFTAGICTAIIMPLRMND